MHQGQSGTEIYGATFSRDGKSFFAITNGFLIGRDAVTGKEMFPDRKLEGNGDHLALSLDEI